MKSIKYRLCNKTFFLQLITAFAIFPFVHLSAGVLTTTHTTRQVWSWFLDGTLRSTQSSSTGTATYYLWNAKKKPEGVVLSDGTSTAYAYLPGQPGTWDEVLTVSIPTQDGVEAGAESALQGAQLREFYRQAEEYGKGGIRELANGRFRFYDLLDPSKKPGEMVGRRRVREWDPISGSKRFWHETLDQSGKVRILRPQREDNVITHYLFNRFGQYEGTR